MAMPRTISTAHPPPVTIRPIFLSRPLFVKGTPVNLEIRDWVAEILRNLFQENPPLFISSSFREGEVLPRRSTSPFL